MAIPCACLAAIVSVIGCGLGDWDRKLSRGYSLMEPGGGVHITREGGLDGGVQAIDEAVAHYWTDGDYLAAKLENASYSSSGARKAIPDPYLLIDMQTNKWQRFATEKELIAALPAKAALKWSVPSPSYGCPCCSAVILAAFLPFTLVTQRRRARPLDPDLP
ncbi:MAG: hypothetical protein QM783_00655 [Phycisphaerales bacterium]